MLSAPQMWTILKLILLTKLLPASFDGMRLIDIEPYNGLNRSHCIDGLVENMDQVIFHSQVRSENTLDVVHYSSWKGNETNSLCFLLIPSGCISLTTSYCNCIKTETRGVYNVTITFKATSAYSEHFLKGDILTKKIIHKHQQKIPRIYNLTKDTTSLYINGDLMKTSGCRVKIKGNEVSVLYICNEDSPGSCWLEIIDGVRNKTLTSGSRIISFQRKLRSNKTVTFRNEMCGLKQHMKTFQCDIIVEQGISLDVQIKPSVTGCDGLLLSGLDPVVMSSVIVTDGSGVCSNGLLKFTKTMRNSLHFTEICTLNISSDCIRFSVFKKCSCNKTAGAIHANTWWLADTHDSDALTRAELLCPRRHLTSEVRRLPRISCPFKDVVQLYINDVRMYKDECRVSCVDDQAIIALRCQQSASPCWLAVVDKSTNTKIKSGSDFVSFALNLNKSMNLIFTYHLCNNKSRLYNFTCVIIKGNGKDKKAPTPVVVSIEYDNHPRSWWNLLVIIIVVIFITSLFNSGIWKILRIWKSYHQIVQSTQTD